MNKRILFIFLLLIAGFISRAQKIDSIFFHLYTDSLKKGTHNYINVDGKLSNGKWKPLTSKEIIFSADYGIFEGNELILPAENKVENVTIKAVLRSEPKIWKEIKVWIKKKPDNEILPTKDEILNKQPVKSSKGKEKTN